MSILINNSLQLQLINSQYAQELQKDTDLIQWAEINGIKFYAECNCDRYDILQTIFDFLELEEITNDDIMIAICESCDEFSEFYDELKNNNK